MKYIPSLFALVAAMASATPAQAKTVELAPSTVWNLHYDDDSCVLRRGFGGEEQYFQIELRRFSPTSGFQMAAFGKGLRGLSTINSYRFFPDEEWVEARYAAGNFGDMKGAFMSFGVFPPDYEWTSDEPMPVELAQKLSLEYAARIDHVDFHARNGDNVSLATGPLDKPLMAMANCLDELVTHWGLDPATQKKLSKRPVPVNQQAVVRMMDYPPKMIKQGLIGVVNVRLGVTDKGTVSSCKVQMQLSDPEFEEYACGDLQHSMEFEPALDEEGRPVESFWTTTVRYRLN